MLSGVKSIPLPPEQVEDDGLNAVSKVRKNSDNSKKKEDKSKGKSSRNSSSDDDDDELDKIKKHSRKRIWYSSHELSSSETDKDENKQRGKTETRFRSGKEVYTCSDCKGRRQKSRVGDGNRNDNIKGEVNDIARKEMGLDSMRRSESKKPPVEEEVFEAHMALYEETQHQSTDRLSQDPTEERRVEYDNWVEVSGSKSGDQVLGSGSFNTSYPDSSPSSSGSTARSTRPSAKPSHLVQDLRRQLSELKCQQILAMHRQQQGIQELQELRERGKRSEERWQQFVAMHQHQQQQQPHPFNPIPLFYPPPPYQHYVAFQSGAYTPPPWCQQQPQPFIPFRPPLFYPPPPYQHYFGFQQGSYMPPPSYQQQHDTNQSGSASHTPLHNYFLSPPQVFPGTTARPAAVNQPPT